MLNTSAKTLERLIRTVSTVRPGARAIRRFTVACALLAPALGPEAFAAPLPNGDFETGDFSFWSAEVLGPPPGNEFDIVVNPVVVFDVTGSGPSFAARFQAGFGGGQAFQFFNVANAATYDFGLDVATQFTGGPTSSNLDGGTYTLRIDGMALDSFAVGQIFYEQPVRRDHLAGSLLLDAGMHRFEVDMMRNGGLVNSAVYFYIDNASAFTAPVPEPADWAMLSIGLCALGWLRRRTKPA